jgi:hypothetical protein
MSILNDRALNEIANVKLENTVIFSKDHSQVHDYQSR